MVTSASRLLVIAAAAACGAALAQPSIDSGRVEREQQLLEQIRESQAAEGLYAEGLIEPFRGLGLLYQESGDHALAVAAFSEARQLLRANHGLFSATVDEALLLQQQIRSEKALGNGERVWNLQHELIIVARENLDDIRMLPVFLELIDDRTERLDDFSTTSYRELPAGLYVPCGPLVMRTPVNSGGRGAPVPVSDARNCEFGSWRTVVDRLRGAVMRNHADAIAVLIRNGDFASQELRDLERQALRRAPFARGFITCSVGTFNEFLDADLVGSCLDPAGIWDGVGGWPSLMRLVYYEVRSASPPAARARAYADLGDWYVHALHVGKGPKYSPADEVARTLYQQALAALTEGDDTRESMAEIFAPELPVTLPTYAPNPLASTKSSRFVDVAFVINPYGEAAELEILDSSENATGAEERALLRLIKYGSFRPRAVNGEIADSAPVVLRYYLPEKPASGG
jgi:tetratricopeptide (TPR) repeat protein